MEKAYIQRYNNMHMIHKTFQTYQHDYTDNFDTQFRPLPEVVAYDTYFVDPQYGPSVPIGMKTYMIKINWSTMILTTNVMIKSKVMI